jgi:hypothetical protein
MEISFTSKQIIRPPELSGNHLDTFLLFRRNRVLTQFVGFSIFRFWADFRWSESVGLLESTGETSTPTGLHQSVETP